MKKALVIEDDEAIRSNIVELLNEEGFNALGADNGRRGLELARSDRPELVICDIRMPELDGFGVLAELRSDPTTRTMPFIFLSAAADRADVRKGMNLGADDYVTKPFTRTELLDAVRSRLERQEVLASSRTGSGPPSVSRPTVDAGSNSIVVSDVAMRALYEEAGRAAVANISILLLGETGVGKEVLAHSIHQLSPRRDKPFMALNCAALTETLLESELFGNERGAFTGAVSARPGLFEAAEGGTVFLDELGELPMVIQVKLLRVLEERRVMRVGGRTPIAVDVRFISATNRDLEASIERGTFREDLFYRLNGITLEIPPLRDRPSEVLPLANRFVDKAIARMGRADPPSVSDAARSILQRYGWPGNVRELRNVMERAVVMATGNVIEPQHLPAKLLNGPTRESLPAIEIEPASRKLRGEVEDLERKRIMEALERCGGNQTAAADLLGMSRRTLVTRLSTYDLPRPRKKP